MRRLCGALIMSAAAAWAPVALADEVVQFTNGAEMTVRSHTIEKDMVKLDLGGSSSITFPISMVDKISSAGKNVFLNPVYHPSNVAVPVPEGSIPNPLPDRGIRGGGPSVGYRVGQTKTGTGLRMGEAINDPGDGYDPGSGRMTTVSDERTDNFTTPRPRRFNPIRPEPPGTRQTIDAPGGGPAVRTPSTIQLKVEPPVPPPPTEESQPEPNPPSDQEPPPAQDPPESH